MWCWKPTYNDNDAIAAYNHALTLAPDYVQILNNKGTALFLLGLLQIDLSQPQETFKSWQAALAAFSRCLEISPNDEYIRNQRDELLEEFLDKLGNGTE